MSAKKQILVTGGTGYIGSHTVVELLAAGYEPIIVDNLSNSSAKIIDQIEKITGVVPVFQQPLCIRRVTALKKRLFQQLFKMELVKQKFLQIIQELVCLMKQSSL